MDDESGTEASDRCSNAARARGDLLAGTAPHAKKWILIEHPGPWARTPAETPPLGGAVGRQLEDMAQDLGGKVLLIRRPGRVDESGPRSWFVVDTMTGLSTTGSWTTERDLLSCANGIPGVNGPMADDAPHFVLVCTHGVRDACCAIRGRPIAGQLAKALPEEVWECTHLGGHRFAGTMLLLPDGACYGRLDPADALRVVREHRAGRPDPDHLRGWTRHTPAEQAAYVDALRRDREGIGPGDVSGSVRVDAHHVRVAVAISEQDTEWVDVHEVELEPAPVSCGKGPERRVEYRVVPGRD